jgi:hypothetical protein
MSSMFDRPEVIHQRIVDNKKELLKSKVIAKAVLKSSKAGSDGTFPLIVLAVYEKSTTYEFYWKANIDSKSPRAPRKKWLKAMSSAKIRFAGFRDYVDSTARFEKAEILSFRIINKKKLNAALLKCHKDSLSTDWHEAIRVVTPADVMYVNRKSLSKRQGIPGIGWGRR